jgi:hypothetical protein
MLMLPAHLEATHQEGEGAAEDGKHPSDGAELEEIVDDEEAFAVVASQLGACDGAAAEGPDGLQGRSWSRWRTGTGVEARQRRRPPLAIPSGRQGRPLQAGGCAEAAGVAIAIPLAR